MTTDVSAAKYRALVSIVVLMAFLLVRALATSRVINGDTAAVVHDTERILQCLRTGVFHGCNITHFPLFQFIPSLLLKARNASDSTIFALLTWLNWAAFAATVVLMWSSLREQATRTVALVAVFVLLTGPLLPYTVETFNEPTAAFLILAFSVAALAADRLCWVVTLCLLSAITKETAPPFLFLIGLLGLFRRNAPPRSKGTFMAILFLAAATGVAINSGFNYFRYDSLLNSQLLAREFRVDTLEQGAINFAGIWVSPNGGIIPFWFSFAVVGIVILVTAVAAQPQWPTGPWPARLLALLLFGLTFGLSSWYAPLGWFAWGPRLVLPWLPAIVYLTCYFYPAAIEKGVASLSANVWRLSISTAVFAALAVPNFFTFLDARLMGTLFQPDDVFPELISIQGDRSGYFAQINYLMWSKRSMMVDCYNWVLQSNFRDKVLLYVVCIAILAQAIAASARESPAKALRR